MSRAFASAGLLMVALFCAEAAGDDLGRLFFTARERAQLERVRSGDPIARPVQLQGMTARRDGPPLAWVDDRPVGRGQRGEDFVLLEVGREGAVILRDTPRVAAGEEGADAP